MNKNWNDRKLETRPSRISKINFNQNVAALHRISYRHFWKHLYNLYNKRRYVCLFVCLFVPYGRPNGWAHRDQTWHTHSCPPRECFWQGQSTGHSRMRAGLTEIRNTRNATPSERRSHYVRTVAAATPSERLWNAVELRGDPKAPSSERRSREQNSVRRTGN